MDEYDDAGSYDWQSDYYSDDVITLDPVSNEDGSGYSDQDYTDAGFVDGDTVLLDAVGADDTGWDSADNDWNPEGEDFWENFWDDIWGDQTWLPDFNESLDDALNQGTATNPTNPTRTPKPPSNQPKNTGTSGGAPTSGGGQQKPADLSGLIKSITDLFKKPTTTPTPVSQTPTTGGSLTQSQVTSLALTVVGGLAVWYFTKKK